MSALNLLRTRRWDAAVRGRMDLARQPQRAEVEAAAVLPPRGDVVFDPLRRGRRLRVLLAYGHYDYGMPRRGISYETTAFRDPLHLLGCDLVEARLDVLSRRVGIEETGRTLLELAFRHDVDVVFVIPFKDEVSPRALSELRDTLGIPVIAWFCDDHWRFDSFTTSFLEHISVAVTTSREAVEQYWARGFRQVVRSQWSVNHRIFRPLALPQVHDLCFIGQPHSDRPEMVRRLRAAGINVETRGFGWPEGRVSLREMVTLCNQSRVCLNFSAPSRTGRDQVKGRDFEVPAMARPLLRPRSEELDEYFAAGEIVTFSDGDDLVDKARALLDDATTREAVARAGHARVLRDHAAEQRLAQLFTEVAGHGWLGR